MGGVMTGFLMLVMMVTSAYTSSIAFILNQLVHDKETQMHESLKIMSMSQSAYTMSYVLVQGAFSALTSLILYAAVAMVQSNTEKMGLLFLAIFLFG